MGKKLRQVIELIEWDHTCGDGCCYSWGTELHINGEEVHHNISELGTDGLIKLICEKLNVEVEVISR